MTCPRRTWFFVGVSENTEQVDQAEQIASPLGFFPLPVIRDKQAKALDFFCRMVNQGFRDIVIAAPTGSGKSALGAALCFWAGAPESNSIAGGLGGYYLCTQKLLQDQLEKDVERYPPLLQGAVSLKSAVEYECPGFGNCGKGRRSSPMCHLNNEFHDCNYMHQRDLFVGARMSITNYPYFFTERTFVKQLMPRRILVADECHTLEEQVLKFIELTVGEETLQDWAPTIKRVPEMKRIDDFCTWLKNEYLPVLKKRQEMYGAEAMVNDDKRYKDAVRLDTQISKTAGAIAQIEADPDNWVYWQEHDKNRKLQSIAKPLDAAPYVPELLTDSATIRVYMSAYPGKREVFCRSLGLDPDKVAGLSLGSVFAKEKRPINLAFVGSMSKTNIEATLPSFLRVTEKIMAAHANEKGIIHCNSYLLGDEIFKHFKLRPSGSRLLYPRNAEQRAEIYRKHLESSAPTIILSPSFTEGFDFADDSARWQIIAKCPYGYLGDRQISAKKDLDEEWYSQRCISTIIQASGRAVRSENDFAVTYILDSDFVRLWEQNQKMFPNWYKEAMVWHTRD